MGNFLIFNHTIIQLTLSLFVSDMSNTFEDPLARTIRKKLRSQGIGHEIPVVYSTEKPNIKLLPLPDEEFEKGKVHELSAMDDFRVRILPVLGQFS